MLDLLILQLVTCDMIAAQKFQSNHLMNMSILVVSPSVALVLQ